MAVNERLNLQRKLLNDNEQKGKNKVDKEKVDSI